MNDSIELTDDARRIHSKSLLIDGHNDLAWQLRKRAELDFDRLDIARPQPDLHTDIPRLRAGGVGAQFWAAYVPPEIAKAGGAARYALEQIDAIRRLPARYPDTFELADTADDVERIHAAGRIASIVCVEGGHAIENSLAVLRMFRQLGARYMTLTHIDTIDWADAATDEPRHGGLTDFGEAVVREMNALGMLVDISHVSADTMRHVLRVSSAPVIASHSNAAAVTDHPRNVPDDVLESLAESGGVCMVNFCSGFLHPEAARRSVELFGLHRKLRTEGVQGAALDAAIEAWEAEHPSPTGTVQTVLDHIDHIVKVAGIDHVGLGSDFDGISRTPTQLHDVSCYPNITQGLFDRGFSEVGIRKVLGGNILRTMRAAERHAAG